MRGPPSVLLREIDGAYVGVDRLLQRAEIRVRYTACGAEAVRTWHLLREWRAENLQFWVVLPLERLLAHACAVTVASIKACATPCNDNNTARVCAELCKAIAEKLCAVHSTQQYSLTFAANVIEVAVSYTHLTLPTILLV